jgi:hypothetical protein
MTVAFTAEVAFCHRCKWTANVRTLSRDLGLTVAPETREQQERRARLAQFATWGNTCYLVLVRRARHLTERAEIAKKILAEFPDCEEAWEALAEFYHSEAELFGALDFLACEKLSLWLEAPMTKDNLFALFSKAMDRAGVANAA